MDRLNLLAMKKMMRRIVETNSSEVGATIDTIISDDTQKEDAEVNEPNIATNSTAKPKNLIVQKHDPKKMIQIKRGFKDVLTFDNHQITKG